MAISGCILFLFVVGHLIGNLQIYEGPDKLNRYAVLLRSMPALLWSVRTVLLAMVLLHIWSSVQLAARNISARPVGYRKKKATGSSYASRTMYWSGPIILAFVIYHLLDFTFGKVNPHFEPGNVYGNVVASFQVIPVAAFYIIAMLLLCLHLYHGLWSMFQSLGIAHPRYTPMLRRGAAVLATLIALGNISIPSGGVIGVGEIEMQLDGRVPAGEIEKLWDQARFEMKLVNPANKRKHTIIVVGSGLAGASAAATLGELGYNVKCFCFQDSPRRAHSIAAQGGINAAKNYHSDGDSVFRLFYDTVKGGDFRSREANVYRLAQISVNIIDQCVAQGVPFAREYGGTLANRSFGGAQVSRTFYARGQTGQQLLLGAYQALGAAGARRPRDDVSRAPRCWTWWWSTGTRAGSSRATW